jgi:hypothetical protein
MNSNEPNGFGAAGWLALACRSWSLKIADAKMLRE